MVRQFLVMYLPFLGKYKRFFVALRDCVFPTKESYSQHGEDRFILEVLNEHRLENAPYVDIGANHPTSISNTFLLYRKGYSGIVIEPNEELIGLFRLFRKKDKPLMIGCGCENTIMKFNISKTPIRSSFLPNDGVTAYRTLFVPVLRLDDALRGIPCDYVSLLSIDAEGLSFEVLLGAMNTAKKALLVCIEIDGEDEKVRIASALGGDFLLIKSMGCNLLFLNKRVSTQLQKQGPTT